MNRDSAVVVVHHVSRCAKRCGRSAATARGWASDGSAWRVTDLGFASSESASQTALGLDVLVRERAEGRRADSLGARGR